MAGFKLIEANHNRSIFHFIVTLGGVFRNMSDIYDVGFLGKKLTAFRH